MIRYIKGQYEMTIPNGIVIEISSGIGLEISIPNGSPLYQYGEGEDVMVFTELIVKEDSMSLYGFHNRESLELFKMLTTVKGIGPKGAMAIMGSMACEEIKRSIAFEDVTSLSKAQGIGKKTCERIILELKDKVGNVADNQIKGGMEGLDHPYEAGETPRAEAISALVGLGYSKAEAFHSVSHIPEDDLTSEEYIKKALKRLF